MTESNSNSLSIFVHGNRETSLRRLLLSRSFSLKKILEIAIKITHEVGEIHHALEKSLIKREDVYAEIGEIIIGDKNGRISDEEIILYDATGTALQDVAAAVYIYEKALKEGGGTSFEFPA